MPAEGPHTTAERMRQLTLQNIRQMECSVTLADPSLPDCPLIGCSEGFERVTGYTKKEVVGRNCRFLNQGCTVTPRTRTALRTAAALGGDFVGVLQNRRKNGELFQNFLHMTTLHVAGHRYVLGIQADVTHVHMNLKDEEQVEEVKRVAKRVFAENVDAWIKIQAQDFQRRLPVTYDEVMRDLLNGSHGEDGARSLGKPTKVVEDFSSSGQGAGGTRRQIAPEKMTSEDHLRRGNLEKEVGRRSTPTKAQAERQLAPQAWQVLHCKNTFIHVPEETQDGAFGIKRSASDSLLDRTSSGSVDVAADPDMVSTTSSEGLRRAQPAPHGRTSPSTGSSEPAAAPAIPQEPESNCDAGCAENGPRKTLRRRRRRRANPNRDSTNQPRPAPAAEEPMSPTSSVSPVSFSANCVVKGLSWPKGGARGEEASSNLAFLINQKVHLPMRIDTGGLGAAEREALISGLTFSVEPPLPLGLSLDPCTGAIHGAAAETRERTVHEVTVSTFAKGPGGICLGSVPLAREKMSVRVEDLTHRFRISEVLEERDENGNEIFVVKYEAAF